MLGIVITYLRRAALVVLAAVAAWTLSNRLGPWAGLVAWAALMAVACALGAWLLKSSPVGRVTWRNHVAGYLIPWGYRLGRGKLAPITVAAWAIWVLIGAAAVLLFGRSGEPTGAAATDRSTATTVLLFATWVLYGGCLIYLLGVLLNEYRSSGGRGARSVLTMAGVLVALVVISAAFWISGRPGWALLAAGGPPAVVGGGYGLFLVAILLLGRKARWN